MKTAPRLFSVQVDVTNAGQFFACCGLLELAQAARVLGPLCDLASAQLADVRGLVFAVLAWGFLAGAVFAGFAVPDDVDRAVCVAHLASIA